VLLGFKSTRVKGLPHLLMLVICFFLQTLTLRSLFLWWIPTTWSSYTWSPAPQNSLPLCWMLSRAYEVTWPCSWAVSDPFSLVAMGPDQGAYSEKTVLSMAVPFVAVSIALRMPSKPRVGILYVILQHRLHHSANGIPTCSRTSTLRSYSCISNCNALIEADLLVVQSAGCLLVQLI